MSASRAKAPKRPKDDLGEPEAYGLDGINELNVSPKHVRQDDEAVACNDG